MTVLLAGGNAPLQRSIATQLAASAHRVRVVCDTASAMAAFRGAGIEPWRPVRVRADTAAALDGCEAAVIIDPMVVGPVSRRAAPIVTPLAMLIQEIVARRSLSRLVLIAHRDPPWRSGATTRLADELTRSFHGDWSVLQAATVYGAGDDSVSRFVIMMRTLPAVPLPSDACSLRPLWHQDLARVVVARVSAGVEPADRVLDLHGPDACTPSQLYDRIALLIDRRPSKIPVPYSGSPFALDSYDAPADASDGLQPPGVTATSLDDGLRRIIAELPELTPAQGVGAIQIKRFAIDIRSPRYSAVELMGAFRTRFRDLMPIAVGVEPAAPTTTLEERAVVTMALPGHGHVAIRVEEVTDHEVVVSTLRGHALAGFVRFSTRPLGDGVGFEVMTCDSAATGLSWVGLTLGGARAQEANWLKLVTNVATMAGGDPGDVRTEVRTLDAGEIDSVEGWIRAVIRNEPAATTGAALPPRPS
jgi:hypothetical protein